MGIGAQITEGLRPIVDLIYPPRCPLCGAAIAAQGGLCADCWSQVEVPGDPSCSACQRPMGNIGAIKTDTCFVCSTQPPRHSGVIAASIYNDASRKLILTFKHGGKIALAELLGQLMAARLPEHDSDDTLPLLVPVPLHRWRLWRRGFNQAALLARELQKRQKGELLVDALVRAKQTPSLGGLGREEREAALSGAIRVKEKHRAPINQRDIILVDDVLTSGATSDACVDALLEAGAASVRIACFARVIDEIALRKSEGPKNETPEAITASGAA